MLAALLLAAMSCTPLPTCTSTRTTNCASPTPTLACDPIEDLDLLGYTLYVRDTGTSTWTRLADMNCTWYDSDGDNIDDTRQCRGPDLSIPVQRWCATCAPNRSYDFAIKAYDLVGNQSAAFSNVVPVCFSPLCVRGSPCN